MFESFLNLLEKQQQMLVDNNVEGLNGITDLQREKLVESQILNRRREELIEQIQAANAVEGDLNITRLVELVEHDQAQQLIKLKDIILDLSDKITHTRNQNAVLLNRSREYIAKMMEMLSRINAPVNTYAPGGEEQELVANVVVDRRA